MAAASDESQLDRGGDAFEPVLAPDGDLLYACTEWCSLMRSGFAADFAEAE